MIVAIAGAGTMGHALALVHALGGCQVRLQDISAAALDSARTLIEQAYDLLEQHGAIGRDAEKAAVLSSIRYCRSLAEALPEAELFVETATENAGIKKAIFEEADRIAPRHTFFTSNTSLLDIYPLIPQSRQRLACAVHWYAPPYIIDLVDIAPSEATDPSVPDTLRKLYEGMGKKPVVFSRFIPGYVANRIQAAISREVFHLLEEGAVTVEQVDNSIRHGLALRMAMLGHFMRSDFTGLNLVQSNLAGQTYTPPPPRSRSMVLDALIAQGATGAIAGKGFYDYGDRPFAELCRERDEKLLALKTAFTGIAPIAASVSSPSGQDRDIG